MNVLKANDARDLSPRLAFNFDDLRHQAAAQLAAAQREAAAILEQARRDAEILKQKVEAEAREAGRKEGLKDAAALIEQQAKQLADKRLTEQLKTTLPALNQAAEALRKERDQWLAHWETEAVQLSLAVAQKLMRAEIAVHPERATQMIAEALNLAAGQSHILVRLNPQDRRQLGERAQEIVQAMASCGHAEVIEDTTLSPGDCRIETRHGEIDARVETMLQRIAEELLG